MPGSSIPSLLLDRARRDPQGIAMRVKHRGIYREITWADYGRRVESVSWGFRALGLQPGDRVAILGDPCPEWLESEMGTLAAGGVCFGIYPTSSPGQVASLLMHGGATIVVVRDQEAADKILGLAEPPPLLRSIVVIDPQGMMDVTDTRILSFEALTALPRPPGASVEEMVGALDENDPALIVFTSGTTGDPRGAVHSHRTLIAGAHDYRACLVPNVKTPWSTVCHLPLNHLFEQFNTVMLPLLAPVIPHFGERRAQATETIFEVAPQLYASVPRYWQKMASQILVGIENSSPLKRAFYNWATRTGKKLLQARHAGAVPPGLRLLGWLAWHLALRPLLDKVGLSRVRVGVSGGGPMPPDVQRLWQAWGVNLKNLYGQTEAGFVSVQVRDFPPPGSVGAAAPGVTLKLAEDGEILIRATGSFVGYWQDEAATREMKQGDWVTTGDVGSVDASGELAIIDRKRDIIITQGGKNISPQAIEDKLRTSPYVAEAVVFGEGRKFLSALFEIDEEAVGQWARMRNLTYGGFADLAAAPEVHALIQQVLDSVNAELARPEQIKAFRILSRSLDPELEGEPVTPTRKIKRKQMFERFRDLVESMYDGGADAKVAQAD